MERYLKRRLSTPETSSSRNPSDNIPQPSSIPFVPSKDDIDIPWDPVDRKRISDLPAGSDM
ncbi:hypothetical protein LXL04_020014 [Taraxacum kok-saghyz]